MVRNRVEAGKVPRGSVAIRDKGREAVGQWQVRYTGEEEVQ